MTLVSIIVPTYNRKEVLMKTIHSIQEQSCSTWELIIMDDGSTDGTAEMIGAMPDDRITIVSKPHSGNITDLRLQGIPLAKGDYVAFLDSDDLWLPSKLEFQINLLSNYPDAGFTFCNGYHFGEEDSLPRNCISFFHGKVFLPMLRDQEFIFFVPALLFKKSIVSEISNLSPWPVQTDIDFFLRMAFVSNGIFSNERLVKIRKHAASDSQQSVTKAPLEYLAMVKHYYSLHMITDQLFEQLMARELYKLGSIYLRMGDLERSLDCFKNAWKKNIFSVRYIARLTQVWLNTIMA